MKISKRAVAAAALGLLAAFCALPGSAFANTRAFIDFAGEVGYFYYPKMPKRNEYVILQTDRRLRGIKSDHPETAVLKKKKCVDYYGNPYQELRIQVKGAGVTRLSFQLVKDKTVKKRSFCIQTVKYTNPFRSYKIGDTDLAKKFKKYSLAGYGSVGSEGLKGKIDIRCNKGWRLVRLELQEDWDETYNNVIHNGTEHRFGNLDTIYAYVLHEKSRRLLCTTMRFGSFVDLLE